jgi:flagellar biosynthesis protein FliQ
MDDVAGPLVREAFRLLAMTASPFILVLVVVGLVVGVLQAATQVNDPAVGFLPRAAAGVIVAWLAGPPAVERLAAFLASAIEKIGNGP